MRIRDSSLLRAAGLYLFFKTIFHLVNLLIQEFSIQDVIPFVLLFQTLIMAINFKLKT